MTTGSIDPDAPGELPTTTISSDTTWDCPDGPRIVPGRVVVAGPSTPTLTVEPGCTVLFESGGELVIGIGAEQGVLIANGTPTLPIVFGSAAEMPAPGDWKGIRFNFDSRPSSIENARIENCGGDAERVSSCITVFGDPAATPTDCWPASNSLWQCTGPNFYAVHVLASAGHGFAFLDNSTFTLRQDETTGLYGFSECRVEATASYPVLLEPNGILNIPHDLELINGDNSKFRVMGGLFYGNGGLPQTSRRVGNSYEPDPKYAYSFAGEVRVERQLSAGGTLSLQSGVQLEFDASAGLVIGSEDGYGSLGVNRPDSAVSGVKLTSSSFPPAPGSWRGVVVEAQGHLIASPHQVGQELLVIEYAGAMNWRSDAALTCVDCAGSQQLNIYGATFRNNLHDGVLVEKAHDRPFLNTAFNYLRGENNGGHLVTYPVEDAGRVFFQVEPMATGSGASIRILGGKLSENHTISSATTLPTIAIPYVIDGDVVVSGPTPYPRLEVFNSVVQFTPGSSLQVGGVMNEQGYFNGVNAVFTSATTPTPGAWDGIVVDSASVDFDMVTIEYGGKADGSGANLTFLRDPGAAPNGISNSTVRSSSGCGIRRVGTFTTDFTTVARANTFSANAGGNQCGP